MKKIIALKGKGSSGKSCMLRILAEMLIQKWLRPIVGVNFPEIKIGRTGKPKDFWQVFEWNNIKIGVASSGDTYDILRWQLDNLVGHKCTICFCACRTFDRPGKKGTIAAVRETLGFEPQFVPKTYDANKLTQNTTNQEDAKKLLNIPIHELPFF